MKIDRGIFSSSRVAWIAVAAYTVFLYCTLTLAYDLYVWLLGRVGRVLFQAMTWMYVPLALALLLFVVFCLPRRATSYLAFAAICAALAVALFHLEVPAKRFHFLQYGVLAVLLFDALRFRFRGRALYLWSWAAVCVIGLGDEIVQGLLPKRHFGLLDIGVDSMAGVLSLAFIALVIGEESYPWGTLDRRRRRPEPGRERLYSWMAE